MTPAIIGFLIAIPMIYGINWFLYGEPYIPAFLSAVRRNAKRLQKIEADGKAALAAIRNLHETKNRLNAEFRENWDNEFRLLLPPPEAPKGREALKLKSYYRHNGLYAYSEPKHLGNGVAVNVFQELVPIGFYGSGGSYWYAFNNLSGHQHKVMFISITNFEQAGDKFWAFLPEVKRQGDEWTWQTSKVKTLASNLKDLVIEIRV